MRVSSPPLATALPPDSSPLSLREKWLLFRNERIASARFQRWAAGFFFTRWIARRKARSVFDLVAGFVYSQTLSACLRLNLFEILARRPLSLAVLAPRLGLTEAAAATLVKAAAALGLAQRLPDGRYGLGELGAALRGNPSLAAMIDHHSMLYADLADPVALLRGEIAEPKLASFWAYARNPDPASTTAERVRDYSALMAKSQAMVAGEILEAYPLHRHRVLLDVGGGEGAFLAAAGQRHAQLGLRLFDLPAVAQRAAARFESAGLQERAQIFAGDFFRDSLPRGADIISLVRVLHDHDDQFASALLRRAHAALPRGGVVLVGEPMSGAPGAEPVGDAYFGLYLAAMGSGRPRTPAEIAGLLRQAGFRRPKIVPTRTPLVVQVMFAIA